MINTPKREKSRRRPPRENSAGDTSGGVGGDQRPQASHSGQQAVAQQTAHVPSLGLFHHLAVQLSSTGPIVNANLRFQLLRRRAVIAVRPCAPPRLLLFRCPSTAPCRRRDQSMLPTRVLQWRRIVERTFAWLNRSRRSEIGPTTAACTRPPQKRWQMLLPPGCLAPGACNEHTSKTCEIDNALNPFGSWLLEKRCKLGSTASLASTTSQH